MNEYNIPPLSKIEKDEEVLLTVAEQLIEDLMNGHEPDMYLSNVIYALANNITQKNSKIIELEKKIDKQQRDFLENHGLPNNLPTSWNTLLLEE
jgi:flagellar biosynthesis chaperone FliJ